MFFSQGSTITYRGIDEIVYWAYPAIVINDTPDLIALYMPAGVWGKNSPVKVMPHEKFTPESVIVTDKQWLYTDVLYLIIPEESFCVYLMRDHETKALECYYINPQDPIRRTSIGFDTMDHMLDIVVEPDMKTWHWKDEEELHEALETGYYAPEKCIRIRSNAEKALQLLLNERKAFYQGWLHWQADSEWPVPVLSTVWNDINLQTYPISNNL
jgi:predicted RNA-binding protein associated with RNAse of E/G family